MYESIYSKRLTKERNFYFLFQNILRIRSYLQKNKFLALKIFHKFMKYSMILLPKDLFVY